jgi:16S rRNA (adenine1518-N6/adenine1519-N6)-dimethyltransferase
LQRSQQQLLRQYGIRPVKRRGQNFLVDGNLARAIAQETLAVGERVLELGAGGGALTTHLLPAAARVVCVEVDRNLCRLLETEHGERSNFHLLEADLSQMDWRAAVNEVGGRPVIAGNLPYVLTSKVLFALADLRDLVSGAVFMVQKEVAERLVARPGGKDYGILAVVLGSVFEIRIVRTVPASVFWPQPDVASAVVRLLPSAAWDEREFRFFTATVKTLFGQRRKTMRNQLRQHFGLDIAAVDALASRLDIALEQRPEQIDAADFRRLAAELSQGENS